MEARTTTFMKSEDTDRQNKRQVSPSGRLPGNPEKSQEPVLGSDKLGKPMKHKVVEEQVCR